MFKDPPKSDTVKDMDQHFEDLHGNLEADGKGRSAVDRGNYGAYIDSNSEFTTRELDNDRLSTKDPLLMHPVLQLVRDRFMETAMPEFVPSFEVDTPIQDISDFQRHFGAVQKYLFFKKVNQNLLVCVDDYSSRSSTGELQYDWAKFMMEAPDECVHVRTGLLEAVMADP